MITTGGEEEDSEIEFTGDVGAETYESEHTEDFDMDVGESSDGEKSQPGSEGDEVAVEMERAIQRRPRATNPNRQPPVPRTTAKGKKKAVIEPTRKKTSSTSSANANDYNPEHCGKWCFIASNYMALTIMLLFIPTDFTIRCTVRRRDDTNAPFEIQSTITYDDLRTAIGEKIEQYPGLVRPQYRLDSDKAKQGLISIQSDNELEMFIRRLRPLIVPARLANGKPSARPPKDPLVCFEDASIGNSGGSTRPNNSNKSVSL